MLPGFNNWKNDIYMSLGQEGFTGAMDKEEFTTDELDQLNAIISEEESQDFKDTVGMGLQSPTKQPSTTMKASLSHSKGVHDNSRLDGISEKTNMPGLEKQKANNPVHTVPSKLNSKPLPTKSHKKPEVTKPVVVGELPDTEEPDEEVVAPALDEVDEEEPSPVKTKSAGTKEGFVGSQVGIMAYLGRLLIVIILTAGSALIHLKQTETLLNRFIDADYLIYAKLGIFALFAYVILSIS